MTDRSRDPATRRAETAPGQDTEAERADWTGQTPEDDRVRRGSLTASASDTEVRRVSGAPDPDLHRVAAADTVADAEAGADPDASTGRTEPLRRR